MRQETFTNDRLSLSSAFGKLPFNTPQALQMARNTQNRRSGRPQGRIIGYARVSTDEQATEAQEIELRSAGCDIIVQEHGSGASRARPALSNCFGRLALATRLLWYDLTAWRARSVICSR